VDAASASCTRPHAHVLPQRCDRADCLTANLSRSLALLQSSDAAMYADSCSHTGLGTPWMYLRLTRSKTAWQGLTGSSQLELNLQGSDS